MTKNSKTGNPSAQHDITYLRFAQKEFKPKSTKGLMIRALYSESLRALKENKVIILQAPPGFGKQSLASYLHKKTNGLVIWITFTAKDNDPSIFIQKLTHALALSDIHLSPYEATHLQNTTEEDVAYIISQALLGINDVTFFFNDTHHLQHTFINTLLSVLLLNTTNSVRFLLSSIFPHSLNITSLAIHNQIHYVNIDTLRFNQTEATSLIGSSHKLLKYCQGWGAALTFIKHQQDQGLTIQESMSNVEKENQYIDHYFRENAFSNLSDEEEKTYIKLSTTDRFTLSQASEITNIHDLPRLTKIIEKQPFLLTIHVKGQQWFYYHNIFLHYLERLREHFFQQRKHRYT